MQSANQSQQANLPQLRQTGGYVLSSPFGLIEVHGPDSARFLHAQTTNDVSALQECMGQPNAILDRKAHVQAYFDLYRHHKSFRLVAAKSNIQAIIDHLDHFRFSEKVEFFDLSNRGSFILIQGPKCRKLVASGLRSQPSQTFFEQDLIDCEFFGASAHLFRKSLTGETEGFLVWIKNADHDDFVTKFLCCCKAFGFTEITEEELKVARIEAGIPEFGVDFDSENLIVELGLEDRAISYTKGCFLGQEVLARVKSHGAPSRGLIGVMFAEDQNFSFPLHAAIKKDGQEVGRIQSCGYSTMLERTIGFALLKRDLRVPDLTATVDIGDHSSLEMTVKTLPFYHPPSSEQLAKALYDRALSEYAQENDQDLSTNSNAEALLREALDLNPLFEDAYEALGVILSKRDQLEEAISLMKRLAEINLDSVMAHTNLSTFYVQQGLKELAEEEMAISMSIRMKLAAREVAASNAEKEKAKEEEEETRKRMEMFKEVLEIDSEDLLANYGLGSCFVALKQFEDAIPLLQKALAVKPTHTVAYVALAEAFEGLNRYDESRETYLKGIEVASKRGDMTPLKLMQEKLANSKEH